MSDQNEALQELKIEAKELNISFSGNISESKLKAKIEAHYQSQETSGPALTKIVEKEKAAPSNESIDAANQRIDFVAIKRKNREKAAKKTRIITIIDNDQRQNNLTTTCIVNCSNQFFDLGTRILPLGEKIEVSQGHINVLKEVFIPIHARNPKTGLSMTKQRARYSISYEGMDG